MKPFFAWIKRWYRTAVEASTRVEFYRSAGGRKTGEAIGHLAMLAVLWTLPLSVMFFLGLRQASMRLSAGLRDDIPPGTVFEMKNGHLENNLVEPLVFRGEDGVFIVNTASSTLALEAGETGVVINPDGIEQQDDVRGETMDFKKVPDFRVDREGLMGRIARWAPLALFVASLLALASLFLTFWAGLILSALMHGFTLWLLLKLIKRQRPWREAFIVASYAATASVVLSVATMGLKGLSGATDIVYWAYIAWIAYDAYKGGAHERKEEAAGDRPRFEGKS